MLPCLIATKRAPTATAREEHAEPSTATSQRSPPVFAQLHSPFHVNEISLPRLSRRSNQAQA